jgi:hypothetical protein
MLLTMPTESIRALPDTVTVCTLPKLSSVCTPTRSVSLRAAGTTSFPRSKVDSSDQKMLSTPRTKSRTMKSTRRAREAQDKALLCSNPSMSNYASASPPCHDLPLLRPCLRWTSITRNHTTFTTPRATGRKIKSRAT